MRPPYYSIGKTWVLWRGWTYKGRSFFGRDVLHKAAERADRRAHVNATLNLRSWCFGFWWGEWEHLKTWHLCVFFGPLSLILSRELAE